MFYRKLCSAVHLFDSICKIWWVSMYPLNHCNWMSLCIHSFFEMNWWKSIAGSPNLWSWNRNRWSWTNILMSFLTVGSWLISPDLPFNIPKKHVYSPIWGDFATDFRRPFGHGFPGLTHVNPLADSPGVIFQHQTPQAVTHGISILFGVDPSIFYPRSRYFPGSSEIISYHILSII